MTKALKLMKSEEPIADVIDPKLVIQEYVAGNLNYLEAHRLILEAGRTKTLEYLLMWNYELTFAADLQNLMGSKQTAILLQTSMLKH